MSVDVLSLRARLSYPQLELDVREELSLSGVTALFGPSGSGKSTLLRLIAGLKTPRAGRIALGSEVWFDSRSGVNVPAHCRSVGFMFQDSRLFDHLSVKGNLEFADKRSSRDAPGIVWQDVVAALDLEALLERRSRSLSGGERQRVALARSLLTRPRLLMLDEPLSALDDKRKAEILPYLERIPRHFDIPTIFVSHALDEIVQLAGSMIVLAEGRVQAYGPTAAIVERLDLQPITGRLEAGVLVHARVRGHDSRLALTHVDLDGQPLKMPIVKKLAVGETVRLRIPARDVAVAVSKPGGISIRNVLAAKIERIAVDGDSAFTEVFMTLRSARIRARLTRDAVEKLNLTAGMPVFALIKSVSFDRRIV